MNTVLFILIGIVVGCIPTIIVARIFVKREQQAAADKQQQLCENAAHQAAETFQNQILELKNELARLQTELALKKEQADKDATAYQQQLSEQQARFDKQLDELNGTHSKQVAQLKDDYLQRENNLREEHHRALEQQKEDFNHQLEQQKKDHSSQLEQQKASFSSQLEQQMKLLREEFDNSSQRLLKERQQEFKTSSTESINQVLNPLREQIKQMSNDMNTTKGSQAKLEEAMKDQIRLLLEKTQLATDSANNLTMALKGQNKTQGDYGERHLEEMLCSFGFQPQTHILTQEYITDVYGRKVRSEEDTKMRPDVILKTDPTHVIVIDSKMVLKAYMDYIEAMQAGNEQALQEAISANTEAILRHVNELAAKNYPAYIQKPYETVQYTLMYVPVSGALRLAQANRPGLWHEALKKNILIVDEYSLYAMLKVIELTWARIEQNNNSQRIVDTATLVLERVEALLERFVDAEAAVAKASEHLQAGRNLLTDGGTSIVTAANTLRNLGIHPKSKEYDKRRRKSATIHEELGELSELDSPSDSLAPQD